MGNDLNNWVIDLLKANNMSMRQLAKLSHLTQSSISLVLSGKRKAGLDFYLKIAKAFNAVPELLYVTGILKPGDDKRLSNLADKIALLSDQNQRHLSDYVDFLINQQNNELSPQPPKKKPPEGHKWP